MRSNEFIGQRSMASMNQRSENQANLARFTRRTASPTPLRRTSRSRALTQPRRCPRDGLQNEKRRLGRPLLRPHLVRRAGRSSQTKLLVRNSTAPPAFPKHRNGSAFMPTRSSQWYILHRLALLRLIKRHPLPTLNSVSSVPGCVLMAK